MSYLNIGDVVRRCDNPNQHGTVLKISDKPRRDMNGVVHLEWSRMVYVEWVNLVAIPGRRHWEPPELLVKVETK